MPVPPATGIATEPGPSDGPSAKPLSPRPRRSSLRSPWHLVSVSAPRLRFRLAPRLRLPSGTSSSSSTSSRSRLVPSTSSVRPCDVIQSVGHVPSLRDPPRQDVPGRLWTERSTPATTAVARTNAFAARAFPPATTHRGVSDPTLLGDRFEVRGPLGEGGMGVVLRGARSPDGSAGRHQDTARRCLRA